MASYIQVILVARTCVGCIYTHTMNHLLCVMQIPTEDLLFTWVQHGCNFLVSPFSYTYVYICWDVKRL